MNLRRCSVFPFISLAPASSFTPPFCLQIDIDDNLPETVKVVLLNMLWAVTQGWSEMAKGNFTARHNGGRKLSQSANNKWDEWDEPRWE
jgi:hypothetical protein